MRILVLPRDLADLHSVRTLLAAAGVSVRARPVVVGDGGEPQESLTALEVDVDVRALTGRARRRRRKVLAVGGLHVDCDRATVEVDGSPVTLTPSEFKIVALLANEPGRVFTRSEIMRHLWESSYGEAEHACEVHMSNLRRKLERDRLRPRRIITVRGEGYRLDAS